MKKFLLKVLLFFAFVVILDFVFGFVFSWLRIHAKGGSTANCEYIANYANEKLIILGSSRAAHHYIPHIIEDSLGVSCYNCGEEGNGVVLAYGRLKMLIDRYKPKLILYEITPGYDFGTIEPNTKFLGYLRPYYNKDGIKEIFADFDDDLYSLKMVSKMYQNTSRLLPNIVDNIVFRDNMKGYSPLYGKMNITNYSPDKPKEMEIDSLKLNYVEKVIELAQNNNIPIIFMISPRYGGQSSIDNYEPALHLCEKHDVRVCNYINCPDIANNEVYFQDAGHMNHEGAFAYTNLLIKEILNNKNLYE